MSVGIRGHFVAQQMHLSIYLGLKMKVRSEKCQSTELECKQGGKTWAEAQEAPAGSAPWTALDAQT